MDLLTEIEKKHLQYLAELLDYGSSQLEKIDNTKFEFSHIQSFLLFNHIAIHNYSEAIYLLCKNARPHSAQVILRSLFEANTNSEYIKIGNYKRKLALFAKEGFLLRKKIANGFKNFIEKYPHKKDSLSVLKTENIERMEKFAGDYIVGIDSANKLRPKDKYPEIYKRLIEIDKKSSRKRKGNAELYYPLVFRYLSSYVHLNAFGLENFVEKEDDGAITFILGQTKQIHPIIIQTYLYYLVSLNDLFKKNILKDKISNKYQKYYNELKRVKIG